MTDETPSTAAEIDPGTAPLANGMPVLGLGTWQLSDPETVRRALEMGYRHVDTAQQYDNEAAVGEGIARADVDRDEVFLATKVWTSNLAHGDVLESARESLDRLGVDSLDLLYVHWPADAYDPEETLSAFAQLRDEGLIERIGVSNFEPEQLEVAMDVCDAPVFANQIEMHPLLPQERVREACARYDVEVVAYSPLVKGRIFEIDAVSAVAEKHGVTEAQVSLAWLREKGVTAIPKTTGADHLADNWRSLALELDPEDVERIDAVERTERQVDPAFAPWN